MRVDSRPRNRAGWGIVVEYTLGHTLAPSGDSFTSAAEIGAATAIEIGPDGLLTAVAEPRRRGRGSALVVRPAG